ncbi:MAG TPA: hypothetical protein VFJ51_02105 [Nitrososphaeraceae archaeon]|nr:hypothetical protein [Nitrososphaeraceae archaeon]
MQDPSFKNDELRTRKVFVTAFYFSAAIMLSICLFALYVSGEEYLETGRVIIGDVLVNTEFPFHGFAKLITYLMIASVLSWFCVTKLAGDKLKNVSKSVKSILQLVVLAIAVIAIYEFMYNFILWNSFVTDNAIKGVYKLDGISVPYPNPKTPWNLVFATKMTLAAFLISAHGFYIISRSKLQT